MPPSQQPTVRKQHLGARLKQLREEAGVSREVVAERLGCWNTKIGRIEKGLSAPRKIDLETMLDLYGVEDSNQREALLSLARSSRRKGWWQQYSGVLRRPDIERIAMEAEATVILDFETILVPGLLQTEGYARALMEGCGLTGDAAEPFVAVRMARQRILAEEGGPQFIAVLDEAALHRQVGGRKTMAAQLRHLAEINNPPRVCVQVLPFGIGAHPGIDGPFTVVSHGPPAGLEVVALDHQDSRLYLEEAEQVRRYRMTFDHLRATALSSRQSMDLILRLARDQ
ncbi:helix-turn-helix domain-containing protein [Streptomyces zingiberis]|uniref:Helix-turn-helix domain-containing protein n=1 Tax=Streptomyces zingiberis TaxID=2053010 RepID=A0ABX1BXB2_9ACTN|nr:helix-turn-helix transcriptional regulator [Streptomyces zingiberis]NJQ02271.1 helix-turn-helix domain-containing protein [Streptomyces zingiberis]